MALYKPGSSSTSAPAGQTEFEILKSAHKFLRDDEEDGSVLPWEEKLAQKYYSSLYREFAVCDLKHYKSGNFALRWRTEEEVVSGAGETTCGNTRCPLHSARNIDPEDPRSALKTLELPFSYVEEGKSKFALVKVVLCDKCRKKLMYKRKKEKERLRRAESEARDESAGAAGSTNASEEADGEDSRRDSSAKVKIEPSDGGEGLSTRSGRIEGIMNAIGVRGRVHHGAETEHLSDLGRILDDAQRILYTVVQFSQLLVLVIPSRGRGKGRNVIHAFSPQFSCTIFIPDGSHIVALCAFLLAAGTPLAYLEDIRIAHLEEVLSCQLHSFHTMGGEQTVSGGVTYFTLNNGCKMPAVGIGCWMGRDGNGTEAGEMCRNALKCGYRHVDTAAKYGSEEVVGRAIRDSGIPREEIFLTTKLWNSDHHRVREAFEESLAKLNCGYIDLYMMHFPQAEIDGRVLGADEHPTFIDTWKEMEQLLETGIVSSIHHGIRRTSVLTRRLFHWWRRQSEEHRDIQFLDQEPRNPSAALHSGSGHEPDAAAPVLPAVCAEGVLRGQGNSSHRILALR
ncbi:hypothetical protein NM688_g9158 [Phlebia brevispora]|uniref:Uncharacterized protein n=1 Tax=Phlebia brevispora TaxID=194682 RepID=A0ACC1RLF7_9APHY|nr:hypothetical protein NM688_g9158 [Phlebia brevispora]